MRKTPRGLRLHIGLFGRRNVGKSSLLNAMTRQAVSIVSDVAGTTTDPVEKPMELLPIGPVVFIDTAGVDDHGALGEQRIQRTRRVFDRTDVAVLVAEAGLWGEFEDGILRRFLEREQPVIVVFNKTDLAEVAPELTKKLEKMDVPLVRTIACDGEGVDALRGALVSCVPDEFLSPPPLLGDLVSPGEPVLLVTPIDKEAPKGRLILPQVQAIRDALDHDAWVVVVKENQLRAAMDRLRPPPALVVIDSQVFGLVTKLIPPETLLTSFSILLARIKGDLGELVKGAATIDDLVPGDRVLVAEACTHHPIKDDIGTVKIPRWLEDRVGGVLRFDHVRGRDFPKDISPYRLVIHCGACMWNRRSMLSRILACQAAGVPITNYGIAIAALHGILERAIRPLKGSR